MLPWVAAAVTVAALVATRHAAASPIPALARWSAFVGLGLTLGLWTVYAFL